MVQGNQIVFEGELLVALRNYNSPCQILERQLNCALYLQPYGCRALTGANTHTPCDGYPIIFVPAAKYATLRLLGKLP